MADPDEVQKTVDDLRMQVAHLREDVLNLQHRLTEQESWTPQFKDGISSLFKLSVPAAAGTHRVLGEIKTLIEASGQDTASYTVLMNALQGALADLKKATAK